MEIAATAMKTWREHPAVMVEQLFGVVPDAWQRESLEAFPHNQRIAMCASKGPGKTADLAWKAWNFLLTRPHPKIAATSITADNLADNLWVEMAKWRNKSKLLQEMFTWQKTRIFANSAEATWFMSARPWPKSASSEEMGQTLAGLHADYIMFLIDESGGIPPAIGMAAEAALSSCIEGHIIQAGNTTSRDGMLYEAVVKNRHMWYVIEINGDPDNPNRSPRVDIEWARQQIKTYGRDNPYVMVNILGQFPLTAFNSLIGSDEVEDAMKRSYAEQDYCNAPKVLGVDVAREGDDKSIVFPRQGLQAFTPLVYRNITGTMGADVVGRKWKEWAADGCFVDNTGGFGSSWVDNLVRLGFSPVPIHFNQRSGNPRYVNKRSEMIYELVEWIKRGGAIPNIPDLEQELAHSTYTIKGDKILLEPKELLKTKIGRSPDLMDGLALTFAAPVEKAPQYINGWPIDMLGMGRQGRHTYDYNPLSREICRGVRR